MRSLLRPIVRPVAPTFRSQPLLHVRRQPAALLSRPQTAHDAMRSFHTTAPLLKRKGKQKGASDKRITAIRYFLAHPRTPRPLRFSRLRALRHWTIHRAWHLHSLQRRRAAELALERQFNSMAAACEALRLMDDATGVTVASELEAEKARKKEGRSVGRLYRVAMEKKRVWGVKGGFPIEYARMQTDYPSRDGWNHGWTR